MRRPAVLITAVALVTAAAVAVYIAGADSDERGPLAMLSAGSGAVSLRPAETGQFRPVAESPVGISAGATVRTGPDALATIEYFDGSVTRIGPDTTYEIVELERRSDRTVVVGKIGLGQTFHNVKKLSGSTSRFEIQESNAIAAVRGTRFAARCVPPLPCGIAVVEGVVEVTPSKGNPVEVTAGHRVTIDDAGLLGEVGEVSPEDPWLNRNRVLDDDRP